jgi:hypothetical protein
VPVPTTPTSLSTLVDKLPRHTKTIGLQAPAANAQTVFFGDKVVQTLELRPRASGSLPVTSFKEVFVVGTSGDFLSVVLFDG